MQNEPIAMVTHTRCAIAPARFLLSRGRDSPAFRPNGKSSWTLESVYDATVTFIVLQTKKTCVIQRPIRSIHHQTQLHNTHGW